MPTIQRQFSYERLRAARKNADWSREDLAFALNCTVQTVTNWEIGYATPYLKRLTEISVLLETDLFDFFEVVDD